MLSRLYMATQLQLRQTDRTTATHSSRQPDRGGPTVGRAALLQGAWGLSQHGAGLCTSGYDRRSGVTQAGESVQLVDFCGSGIDGAQVHGETDGGVPTDVAAAGSCMVTVQGLHTAWHYLSGCVTLTQWCETLASGACCQM